MTEGKPYLPWPGDDEQSVVEEMIRDRLSRHWEECSKFVSRYVYAKAKSIPPNFHEEIIQEVLHKVAKSLPGFQFRCTLKTWLSLIVEHCIIDTHRRLRNERRFHIPSGDSHNDSDRESEGVIAGETKSAEAVYEIIDELRNASVALLEYANAHSNPIRDRLIIRMVIFEGHTHAETAEAVGCNAPVVGYVIREAQRYVREKMGHKL